MRKTRLILLLSILFVVSCRKGNLENDEFSESTIVKFFPEESESIKAYAPIIDYLKANDLTGVLIKKLASECGQPLWENVIYTNEKSPSVSLDQSVTTGRDQGRYIILPFIQDSLIKSLLICAVNNENKVFKAKLINSKDYTKWSFKKVAGRMNAHELTAILLMENYRILGYRNFILNDNRILSEESSFIASKQRPFFLERLRYGTTDEDIAVSMEDTEIMNSICMYGWAPCSGDLVGVAPGGTSPGYCPYSICIQWTQVIRDEFLPDPINYNGSSQTPQSDLFSSGPTGYQEVVSFSSTVISLTNQLGLTYAQSLWLEYNPTRANELQTYLQNSTNSLAASISLGHLEKMMTDLDYLFFVQQHYSNYNNQPAWWENTYFLAPFGGLSFGNWAINYLLVNPALSFSTFHNWFFSRPEYTEGEELIDPNQITYDQPLQQVPLPSLSNFETHFPKVETGVSYTQMSSSSVYELVGATLYSNHLSGNPNYQNACAIRGSRSLLYSGITIPVLNYNGSQRTEKGSDNKNYILDAVSFNKFMLDKFGDTPNILTGTNANDPQKVADLLKGKNGIYIILNNDGTATGAGYSGHVDLILNGKCISGAYATPQGGVKSIRVWVLN